MGLDLVGPSPADAAVQSQVAQPAQHADAASGTSAAPNEAATQAATVMGAAAHASLPSTSDMIDQQQQQRHHASDQGSNSAIQVPCPACLGVLQGSEKVLEAVPAAMLAGLPEAEGNAGEWKRCSQGHPDAVAECVRQVSRHLAPSQKLKTHAGS